MNNFKELRVWQYSMDLTTEIYKLLKSYPKEEKYNTADQIKRSSISIPINIAEGSGRKSPKEFIHFLSIANGSCCELETLLIISKNVHLISEETLKNLSIKIETIKKMIKSLQYILNKPNKSD